MKAIKQCLKKANRYNEEGSNYAKFVTEQISEQLGVPKSEVNNYAVCLLGEMIIFFGLGKEIRAGKKHLRMSAHHTSQKMEIPPGADL